MCFRCSCFAISLVRDASVCAAASACASSALPLWSQDMAVAVAAGVAASSPSKAPKAAVSIPICTACCDSPTLLRVQKLSTAGKLAILFSCSH